MTETTNPQPDPLADEIEAAIWRSYEGAKQTTAGLVLANPRSVAAVAAAVARAHTAVPSAPADRAELRDRIAEVLARADGWVFGGGFELKDMSNRLVAIYGKLADAVLAVLPPAEFELRGTAEIRATALREAADRYATLADQNEAYERAEHGEIDHESRLQYEAVRDVVVGLRGMADEIETAPAASRMADEAQQQGPTPVGGVKSNPFGYHPEDEAGDEAQQPVPPGLYRHYKGGFYEVLATARHTETREPLVVYRSDTDWWCRPACSFSGDVTIDDETQPRFALADEAPQPETRAAEVCEGFQWIGQSFATCDRCGQPAWEHDGEDVPVEGAGPFDTRRTARPWKPGQADAMRAKWEQPAAVSQPGKEEA